MFIFLPLIFLLPALTHAHPPVERLDDLIDGLYDECLCEPACEPIVQQECTDIECACALQFQAQDCVMNCMKTQDSVNLYNAFLDSCVQESLAVPTATLPVYEDGGSQDRLTAGSVPTGYGGAGSVVSSADYASARASGAEAAAGGMAAAPTQPRADPTFTDIAANGEAECDCDKQASTAGMYAAGQGGGGAGMATGAGNLGAGSYATGKDGSVISDLSGVSLTSYTPTELTHTGGAVSTAAAFAAGGTGRTPALDATNSFFGSPVSQNCVEPCQRWKSQSDMCTDDTCLCMPQTLGDAQQCSECVGSSGLNGRNYAPPAANTSPQRTDKTMGYWYSRFNEACQAAGSGAANRSAGQQGQAGVEVVPSGLGYASAAGGRGNPNARPMMVTDSSGRTMMADGSEYTNTVTATAAAMYAAETVVVDNGDEVSRRPWPVRGIVALCLGLILATYPPSIA